MNTLFFLHGLGGGHAAWDEQLAYFRTRGYRCVAWDQSGYGGTPLVEPYSLENVTTELKKQLGGKPAILVGHSMGGLIAQEAYARFPELVQAMALCFTSAAFVGGSEFTAKFVAERINPLERGQSMAQIAAQLMPAMSGTIADPAGQARAIRIMSALPPRTYRKAVQLLTTFDRRADLPKIAVPTLLVAGSDDRTAPSAILQKMAAKIPQSEFVEIKGCGHLGPMDQPHEFNAVLEAFFKKKLLDQ